MKEKFGITISARTIRRTVARYKTTGNVVDKPKSGRPKLCSLRAERIVRRIALKNRALSLRQIAAQASTDLGHQISHMAVSRILKYFGLKRRISARVPLLTKNMKRKRLDWAKQFVNWPIVQWRRVLFSDEKIFRVSSNRHGVFVTRKSNEKYHPSCISAAPKHGIQIHIWGAMGARSLAPLKLVYGNLNAHEYQVQVLHNIETLGTRCVGIRLPWHFMQDLAPAHKAHTTRHLLDQKGVRVLYWPGNSPDLNPIENVWAYMARKLPKTLPRNEEELWDRVKAVWMSIPEGFINNLYRSMRRRIRAVIAARGGHTKY